MCEKILKYITSVENELSLYPPGNIVNQEKKEVLRNLHESGISEDLIADQLDLDVNTVKMIIAEIK
jgi:DNA-binding NarL/FixJ family response regulator